MEAHANQGGKSFRLEKVVRNAVFKGDHEDIQKIVDQLCHDYAYAVHQPHARNGGLIGLAAASIALGSVSQIGYTENNFLWPMLRLGYLGGCCSLPEGNHTAGTSLFLRPRCAG